MLSCSPSLSLSLPSPSLSPPLPPSVAGTRKSTTSSAVGADGKDAIALRDEVVELKKSLNSVTRERDLTQARYAKLELALVKKDKEIEDLLASGHITVSNALEYILQAVYLYIYTCTYVFLTDKVHLHLVLYSLYII